MRHSAARAMTSILGLFLASGMHVASAIGVTARSDIVLASAAGAALNTDLLKGGGFYLKDQAGRSVIRNVHRSKDAIKCCHYNEMAFLQCTGASLFTDL